MKSFALVLGLIFGFAGSAYAGNCNVQRVIVQQQNAHHHNQVQVVERVIVHQPVREVVRVVEHVEVPRERVIVRERVVVQQQNNHHHNNAQQVVVQKQVVRSSAGGVNVNVNTRRGILGRR